VRSHTKKIMKSKLRSQEEEIADFYSTRDTPCHAVDLDPNPNNVQSSKISSHVRGHDQLTQSL